MSARPGPGPARGRRRPYAARVPADVRREQLFDAALTIIVRDGYEAVSIDAIAREAGVSRPVVYSAFDGLGRLLGELLDRQQARALAQLADAIPAAADLTDPDALVATTARRLIEQLREDPMTWQPILLAPAGMPDAVRTRISHDRENFLSQLAGLLEIGMAVRGGPKLDAEVMAHVLLAILEHFGQILLAQPDRFDTERLVTTVSAVLAALR